MSLLRRGASPQRLASSIAVGFLIGINPVLGSTTVATIAVAHLCKLNQAAAQIGTHSAYPLQLALFLPLLQLGAVLFGTPPIPLSRNALFALMHQHPWQLVRSLWTWEWHALVVWLAAAAVLTPLLALLLGRIFLRVAQRRKRHVTAAAHA